jgi:preprotein translocase subunit SecB
VVSDLVVRAGFPPVVLNPVNFESLFQAQKQAEAEQAAPKIVTAH